MSRAMASADEGSASRPTFALTFDTELVWGFFDVMRPQDYERRYAAERAVLTEVVRLLDRYEIPATWALVGHLFLSECRRDEKGRAHAPLGGPAHPPEAWYAADPCTNRQTNPFWYGDDIVDQLLDARTCHEIACHSFGHIPYGHPDVAAEMAEADLRACVDAAARRGLTLRSFVFPRNWEGHHEVLRSLGFTAYRGADPVWWGRAPRPLARVAHVVDATLGLAPPVSKPFEKLPGLWNIPGSGFLAPRDGVWRLVSRAARVGKAARGLRLAETQPAVFHVWTHPCNLVTDSVWMLRTLEAMLAGVARERDRGAITVETMAGLADRMARQPSAEPSDQVPVPAPRG